MKDEAFRLEVEETIERIRSLKIQGARRITIACLNLLRKHAELEGINDSYFELADLLASLRPTQAVLYNAMQLAKKAKDVKDIEKVISYLEGASSKIARKWHHIIDDGDVVLTHCHSTELVELMREAAKHGRMFKVVVTETRPKMQGMMTARELSSAGIEVVYVVDSAVTHFTDEVTKFMFGCDAVREEGIYNKIGTYMMAVFAREIEKPCYFVGDVLKIDPRKGRIDVEMRAPEEVIKPEELGENIKVLNPAFDCTPWKYVSAYLSGGGKASCWEEARKLVKAEFDLK